MSSKIGDFGVLAVSYSSQATHYIYMRAHQMRANADHDMPVDRSLFLVNVPPDSTERELTTVFSSCGTVEQVRFGGRETGRDLDGIELEEDSESDGPDEEMADAEDLIQEGPSADYSALQQSKKGRKLQNKKPPPTVVPLPTIPLRFLRNTGSTAHIVFNSAQSLHNALALSSSKTPIPWPRFKATSAAEPHGLAHYLAQYRSLRPPLTAIREHADSSMEVYEYNVALKNKRNSKYKKGEAIVDDDGFTLVTRGGAYGQTLGGGVGVASKRFVDEVGKDGVAGTAHRKKKRSKAKEGFYAFQVREQRIKGALSLFWSLRHF